MRDPLPTRAVVAGPLSRRFEDLIGRAALEQGLERERVELVPRAIGPVEADDRRPGKRQIADCVERLVAHELIGVSQPFRIEDGVAVDRDRVLQRRAKRVSRLQSFRTSPTKPKVRARAISRRNVDGSRSNTRR